MQCYECGLSSMQHSAHTEAVAWFHMPSHTCLHLYLSVCHHSPHFGGLSGGALNGTVNGDVLWSRYLIECIIISLCAKICTSPLNRYSQHTRLFLHESTLICNGATSLLSKAPERKRCKASLQLLSLPPAKFISMYMPWIRQNAGLFPVIFFNQVMTRVWH